jgi:hypothetical protein
MSRPDAGLAMIPTHVTPRDATRHGPQGVAGARIGATPRERCTPPGATRGRRDRDHDHDHDHDGLIRLPEPIDATWPLAVTQTCILHLIRNTFRCGASRRDWDGISKALRPVYTAATEQAAKERFVEFTAEWGSEYPAIIRLWENAWAEYTPFLAFDTEIRQVVCSTNDRKRQRPHPPHSARPRPLAQRRGRPQVRLHGDHEPRPHRPRPPPLGHALETSPKRLSRSYSKDVCPPTVSSR